MLGKVKEVGERLAVGVLLATPVPLRLMVRPDTAGVVVTVNWPVSVPEVVGLNVTLMVHFAPTARLEPQVLVSA